MGDPGSGQADGKIDLHSHSRASDGQYPAEEVAERARPPACASGRSAITTPSRGRRPRAPPRGVWASGSCPGSSSRPSSTGRRSTCSATSWTRNTATLKHFEDFLADHRRRRTQDIIAKLAPLGVRVTVDEVERFSGGKTIGRPHVARAIVETGAVATVKEAFDRYLGEGKPAYVQRFRLETDAAVRWSAARAGP